jgi:hypothetical protein
MKPQEKDLTLLKKYMQHVEQCEGVNFVSKINGYIPDIKFTEDEKALLEQLDRDIELSNFTT